MSGPTIEATGSRVLAVAQILGQQSDKPRQGWRGTLTWTERFGGHQHVLRWQTVVDREGRHGWVDLAHAGRSSAAGELQTYRVHLRATVQPFGGLRWWLLCPRNGDPVCKLYLPNGADRFASRQAYKLDYQSQRVTAAERANNRAWKKRLAMGGETGAPLGAPLDKPLWQHWRTWTRDYAELNRLEARTISAVSASLRRYISLSQHGR
ncbi:hypothetical protein P7D22_19680 [Lichenihabitans sp. Uapishka_5]|uniref:hypothetical protein n=1 Tax=Lichenihabitans sp. Uapishka_5 TaxID=3037302 RepID=UPI0029E7E5B2|nr:hypothetical protein [Lichenihabitans sp. Uapishka_5]MDX7953389.1 hypothetical protein [Lichenihabitans sp. Uapishka_5]